MSGSDLRVARWQIPLVQACNLACRYCATDRGRFGGPPGRLSGATRSKVIEFVARWSDPGVLVHVDLGGGEPFLGFDETIAFIDDLREALAGHGIEVGFSASTNGTLLDEARLRACFDRNVSLTFSIDGPASVHDASRVDPHGRGTHAASLAAFRRFERMIREEGGPCSVSVHSVITSRARLRDVAEYWRSEGVRTFEASIELEGAFGGGTEDDGAESRRRLYLDDLEAIARAEAGRLVGRDFPSEYRGPDVVERTWRWLSARTVPGTCGAGTTVLAVDRNGVVYPCESFAGFPDQALGDVFGGPSDAAIERFRRRREEVRTTCRTCWAGILCVGVCFAADPAHGVVLGRPWGCEFGRRVAEIAIASHRIVTGAGSAG